jgi:exonuclease III
MLIISNHTFICVFSYITFNVAIVVHKSIVKSVVKKSMSSDRIIAVMLKTEPVSILIVQVYMPTSEYKDDEVEELYDVIEEIVEEDRKGKTNVIIMGDWNSVVGDKAHHNTVGPYGLGRRNQKGQMLIDFYERNGFVITNTWFKKPKRRLYTWKSPGERSRFQLDYVLVKQRFRNSVKDVQTLPGEDTDSDRNLLVATICTRLKKIISFQKRKPRWDLEKLYAQ